MGYDYYAVEYELGNLKKTVQEGTPITFAQNEKLIHGKVTGVYDPFFMVNATYTNKFGSVTRMFSFSWTELAIWEVELRKRIKYQDAQKIDVDVVFISDELKERNLTAEDFMESHMSVPHSASSTSYEKTEKAKTKKKRTVKEKSQEVVEAAALQKEEEKKAKEAGAKKDKFNRIYHSCAEIVIEALKKGKVLLWSSADEDGILEISSYCISQYSESPWTMPKGKDACHYLFQYDPVHCLDYTGVGGENQCEADSKAEWRKKFNEEGTFISIYKDSTYLWDNIWIPQDESDIWNTGKYDMKAFSDVVTNILTTGICYLSNDRANVYGPLEIEFAKKLLKENEDYCLRWDGQW